MKTWVLFALFLVVGLGMLIAGIVYLRKEWNDPESRKIYGVVSGLGVALVIFSIIYRLAIVPLG